MREFLLSLLSSFIFCSSIAVADVKQDYIVLADNTTFSSQLIDRANTIVDTTVNAITQPFVSQKEVECLARNIFYEAASEPTEGKIAVAMVTLNRANNPKFGNSICDVVRAKTIITKTRTVKETDRGYFTRESDKKTVTERVTVCQFSWVCEYVRKPKATDERWIESKLIAENIVNGEYDEYRSKYGQALYFHATRVRPSWAHQKHKIGKVGGHIFYE